MERALLNRCATQILQLISQGFVSKPVVTSSAKRAEVSVIVPVQKLDIESKADDEKYGALKRLRTFCAELCVIENNSPVLEPGLLVRLTVVMIPLCTFNFATRSI